VFLTKNTPESELGVEYTRSAVNNAVKCTRESVTEDWESSAGSQVLLGVERCINRYQSSYGRYSYGLTVFNRLYT